MAAVSMALVAIGHVAIIERSVNAAAPSLRIRGDSLAYAELVNGGWHTMRVPFRYRVFVPWLAHFLPISAFGALRLITYLSLFGTYVLLLLTMRRFGWDIGSSIAGLVLVFTSTWHLYNYNNPFLIDGFSLLVVTALVYAVVSDNAALFLLVAIVGVLAKENLVLLVPMWFCVRNRRQGMWISVISFVAFLAPRALLSQGAQGSVAATRAAFRLNAPWHYFRAYAIGAFASWAALWVVLGLYMLMPTKRNQVFISRKDRGKAMDLKWPLGLVAATSVLSSLIARDTARMFQPLAPFVVFGGAQLLAAEKRSAAVICAVALSVVQLAFAIVPRRFFGAYPSLFNRDLFRGSLWLIEVGAVIAMAIPFWKAQRHHVDATHQQTA